MFCINTIKQKENYISNVIIFFICVRHPWRCTFNNPRINADMIPLYSVRMLWVRASYSFSVMLRCTSAVVIAGCAVCAVTTTATLTTIPQSRTADWTRGRRSTDHTLIVRKMKKSTHRSSTSSEKAGVWKTVGMTSEYMKYLPVILNLA